MRTVLEGSSGRCDIAVGESLEALLRDRPASARVVITDPTVRSLHGAGFPDAPVIEIGEGEEAKSLETVSFLYERFLELELDRSAFVVAIGGGLVCDVAAFAASTWMRGIGFGLVPTSLMAQVDAGIGGKNGVNLRGYKNLVGTFRQPEFCLCDPGFLSTLSERELRSGLAEVVKHGAIGNRALFEFVEKSVEPLLARERSALDRVIGDSLRLKVAVVQADETEQGERRKLNFGHTLGHAVERLTGMRHGEAVAVGMALAARLSGRRGLLAVEEAARLEALLRRLGLPTSAPLEWRDLMDAVRRDKKRRSDTVTMALLSAIGDCELVPVGLDELERGI